MLKKYGALAGVLVLPAFLAGCPVDIYTTDYPTHYGSGSSTVIVGSTIPDDYTRPTYTYGKGSKNPIIQSFTANPTNDVPKGQPITFTVVAHDPNNEVLQFNWSATGGTISSNTGQVVSWMPPEKPGVYTVSVTISNVNGFRAKAKYQYGTTIKYQDVLIKNNSFRVGDSKFVLKGKGTAQVARELGPHVDPPHVAVAAHADERVDVAGVVVHRGEDA